MTTLIVRGLPDRRGWISFGPWARNGEIKKKLKELGIESIEQRRGYAVCPIHLDNDDEFFRVQLRRDNIVSHREREIPHNIFVEIAKKIESKVQSSVPTPPAVSELPVHVPSVSTQPILYGIRMRFIQPIPKYYFS